MKTNNLGYRMAKIVNMLRPVIAWIFQTVQSKSSAALLFVSNVFLDKSNIFLILLVFISIFSNFLLSIISGSGLINFWVLLFVSIVALFNQLAGNIFSNRVDELFLRRKRNQAKEHQKQNDQDLNFEKTAEIDNSTVQVRQRRKFSPVLVILFFLSTMLAIFQSWQAQRNAHRAQNEAAIAQAQAEIAKEERLQAERLSLANSDIINVLIESISDSAAKAEKLSKIRDIYQNSGLLEKAIDSQDEILNIYEQNGDLTGQGLALNKKGDLYYTKGQRKEALVYYERALDLSQNNNDQIVEGQALNNIGLFYQSEGQYELALRLYEEARKTYEEVGNNIGKGLTINNIGSIYQALGRFGEAGKLYDQALEAFKKENAKAEQGRTYRYLGSLDNLQESQALNYYQQALNIYRDINSLMDIGRTQVDIGDLNQQNKKYEAAFDRYDEARKIHEKLNNSADLSRALNGMGNALFMLGNYTQAEKLYQEALDKRKDMNDRLGQAETIEGIGQVYEAQGNLVKATIEYSRSIELLENVLTEIRVEEFKTSFVERHLSSYEHIIKLLWSQERFAEAFYYAERACCRAFLDQLSNVGMNFRSGVGSDLLAQEQELRRQMNMVDENQLNDLLIQYEELLVRLKLASPTYQTQSGVVPIKIEELQDELQNKDVTLIRYFVIDEQILAWVIDRDNYYALELTIPRFTLEKFTNQNGVTTKGIIDQLFNITAVEPDPKGLTMPSRKNFTNLSPNEINHLGEVACLTLSSSNPAIVTQNFDKELSSFLHDNLFAPLYRYIRYKNIIIVPHTIFHKLPFAALWNAQKQRYLIEDYALSFVPSASSLKFILSKNNINEGQFLGLVGEDSSNLASTKDEVQTVAQSYAQTPYIGKGATESKLKNQVEAFDILHIASDAVQIPEHPLFSYIELTPDDKDDGKLEIHEIYDLDLSQVNLVVLSGSNTSSLGTPIPSDDTTRLSRAFLASGSQSVISTAWGINGIAAADFMKVFYHYLVTKRKIPSEALQEAQKAFVKSDCWASPYYWAMFTLIGDYQGGDPLNPR